MQAELRTERIRLSTGVTLSVRLGGRAGAEPIIFLHGFPESHRSWRHQLRDLAPDFFVAAPDQRGFAASDKPRGKRAYSTGRIVEDAMALADALGIESFTLAGHDWGGAVAWMAALAHPARIRRLVIVNAPHPLIFQKSLIQDAAQRAASQYVSLLRSPLAAAGIKAMGLPAFFARTIAASADLSALTERDKGAYLDEWSQPGAIQSMLNWYKASGIVVPAPGARATLPLWTRLPFPKVQVPTLVIWGMKDTALLPVQLEGLDEQVDDLRVERVEDAGHFVTWERPEAVTRAIRGFLAE